MQSVAQAGDAGPPARPETKVPPSFETMPADLKEYRAWVLWTWSWRDDGWRKVPYSACTGYAAKTTDSRTWTSFDEVVDAFGKGGYDGVGFVFSTGDPFVGIDLDDAFDADGVIKAWALDVVRRFPGAHAEYTPRGQGLHLIVRGEVPQPISRAYHDGRIELYCVERYFTVTGVVFDPEAAT